MNTDPPVSNSLFCHFGALTDCACQLGLKDEEKERVNIPLKNWIASMMEPAEISTWKQDPGKHELLSVGKEDTDDTII